MISNLYYQSNPSIEDVIERLKQSDIGLSIEDLIEQFVWFIRDVAERNFDNDWDKINFNGYWIYYINKKLAK